MEDTSGAKELPEECWELIMNRLEIENDYGDLRRLSLVCKQFLSITNRIRRKLLAYHGAFYRDGCEGLRRAIDRFPNLKEIELSHHRLCDEAAEEERPQSHSVDIPVLIIAYSGLDLQALMLHRLPKCPSAESLGKLGKNLKVLKCWELESSLRDIDLVAIADALPLLEELDIRWPSESDRWGSAAYPLLSDRMVTDSGIEVISRKRLGLRKIDLSGNYGCSDRSLVALSSNCLRLEEIRCTDCLVTEPGICFVLCHSLNLISLQAKYRRPSPDSSFVFEGSKVYAKGLRELDLCAGDIPVRLLCSIAKAGIPLEKLVLQDCPHVQGGDCHLNFNRLSTFLSAYSSLKHLELHGIDFPDDHSVTDLCRYLPNTVFIKLVFCSNLTIATFFILAKECPALSEIKLAFSSPRSFEVEDAFVMDLDRNYRIRSLDLRSNRHLNHELLKKIVVTCPNLHTLYVQRCGQLTKEGMGDILCCSQVKYLGVSNCMNVLSETFTTCQIKVEDW